MSLILDALRKSEAERRRGQAPDLHAELPPAVQSARPRRAAWPWLLALAITAIAVALAMTWLGRERAPEQSSHQDGGVVPAAGPPAVATIAPAEPEPGLQPRVQPKPGPSAPPPRDTSGGRAVAIPAPAATTPAVERPVASSPPPAASPPSVQPPPAAVPQAATATATAVDKRAPLQLADLAAAERRALPPLKISMHMWAPTSAGRFAIIDGARVNEGDRLGEAVVDEITREGVILAWHGRRVQIPIH